MLNLGFAAGWEAALEPPELAEIAAKAVSMLYGGMKSNVTRERASTA